MGTFNPKLNLIDAVNSILKQSHSNFEFIIYNDGSTNPESLALLSDISAYDDRIKIIHSNQNNGLGFALNKCIEESSSDFLIRMDDDDTCDVNRVKVLLAVAKKKPDLAVIGSNAKLVANGKEWGFIKVKSAPTIMDAFNSNAFVHAATLLRKSHLKKVGYYTVSRNTLRLEDYDLWMKLFNAGFSGLNVDDYLYNITDDLEAYKRRKFSFRIREFKLRYYYYKLNDFPVRYLSYVFKPLILSLMPLRLYKIIRVKKFKVQ